MSRPRPWKTIFFLCVLCAAMAIFSPAQTFTTLTIFTGADGGNPWAGVVQGTDGNFYGTTIYGGANSAYILCGSSIYFDSCGVVFKITPAGHLTTLYSFCSQPNCTDGANPYGGLVQATDGDFYGTTYGGGNPNPWGTVFKITPTGTLTTLYRFNASDGSAFRGGLMQATDGNLYGTTGGEIFKITPPGALSIFYKFCSQANCADGSSPSGALVQATDGNFYGTTFSGGTGGAGTVFQITPGGALTTLHSFRGCVEPNCVDGATPYGGLVQTTDGNFYGTTNSGGSNYCIQGCGTIFKITPGGGLTTLYKFCSQPNCADGAWPDAGLVRGTDGNFYGTTSSTPSGTLNGAGTVFRITPQGQLTTLHSFCSELNCADGDFPIAPLIQATDGKFYGTTEVGATYSCPVQGGCGTIFSVDVGLSSFVETQPTSGVVGAPVIILGNNLTGATAVSFNGTAATFTVVSSTEITTTVPSGATTGLVQVTTPSGTLDSNVAFQVTGPGALRFLPLAPCRIADTRNPASPFGGPAIAGKTSRSFPIPASPCLAGVPATVAAYSLNVTAVPEANSLGYLTIWPTGQRQPVVSTLNSLDGRAKANAAIVPAGTGGAISVYVTDPANVVLDINGYFLPANDPSAPLAFFPLPPCRIADTRNSSGPLGGPSLAGGQSRSFPVLSSSCNIPATAHAYSLNFTAIPHEPLGYLTTWPTGMPLPLVSTLNAPTGTVTANAAIVPGGINGEIMVYVTDSSDVVIDINGYFAPSTSTTDLSLYTLYPCRIVDTRKTTGMFSGSISEDMTASGCGVPPSAKAVVLNATVVPGQGSLGYLTLWPNGQAQPLVSTLNALDGLVTSNMAVVPTSSSGVIDAFATDPTQLILDTSGYFASATSPP